LQNLIFGTHKGPETGWLANSPPATDGMMKYAVKHLKNLAVALKELEPHIRHGRSLQVHPEFRSIRQRPRELLANWLLCAVGCASRGRETLVISQDPLGGDGLITDRETGEQMFTEHVYIPPHAGTDFGELTVKALEHKVKKGDAYAAGLTLIILSEATGLWHPNRLARQIAGTHKFKGVWVVHLDARAIAEGRYAYLVAELDVSAGDAPVSRVAIAEDFGSWSVDRVQ
jgi:hypothetical protein